MNLLIADSGTSKTDWVILQGKTTIRCNQTIGFNPYFQSSEAISKELRDRLLPELQSQGMAFQKVVFYGSGCSNEDNKRLVASALQLALGIQNVEVEHDLLAAARALCGRKAGIAAILGTGSNSCLYDGENITHNLPSGGYLWGDQGGGSQLGKLFIRDYFEDELPADLVREFEYAGYNRDVILDNVYRKPYPSRYLATVSRFLSGLREHPHVRKILIECFSSFFSKQILKYPDSRLYKVGVVGSVGFFYRDVLQAVAADFGYQLGEVLQSPMPGLIRYHQSSLG